MPSQIDFVSGFCYATASDSPAIVGIGAGTLGTNIHCDHPFTSQHLTNNLGSNVYAFSQQTHLDVEPGESFWVLSALHDSGSHCDVTVTGFLVNA